MARAGYDDDASLTQWIASGLGLTVGDYTRAPITMPEDGTADTLAVFMRNSNDYDRENIIILTDSSGNRLYSSSSENSGIGGSGDWRTVDVSGEGLNLTNGTTYWLGIQSETANPNIGEVAETGGSWDIREGTWGVDDDPITGTVNGSSGTDRTALVYIDYTPGAGIPPAPTNPGNEITIVAASVDTGPESVGQFLEAPNPADGDVYAPASFTAAGGVVTNDGTMKPSFDYTALGYVPATDTMVDDYYDSVNTEAWDTIITTLIDGEIDAGSSVIVRSPVVDIVHNIVIDIIKPIILEGDQ